MQESASDPTLPSDLSTTNQHLHQPLDFDPGHASDSSDLDKDLEKGDPEKSKDTNEVDQGALDRRQTKEEDNLVGWDGPDDPQNPQNWSKRRKYMTTVFYATLTFTLTFASSVFSTATEVTAKLYGVSNEVMTLGTSLFVLVCADAAPLAHALY